eukprot:TRINITY_DN18288_c0_g1_i1.p1 TRINITY_DN18288_c0_g1~~TRINITY_DN18288_c0_g1_i1.p1  ORF type:complete len:599 (+),score=149.89 TRINITY_DN18288_c0_g1_i1:670-2466(+)
MEGSKDKVDASQDSEKRSKKRIVPHKIEIRDWTIPRRPFQPVVTVQESGGLKVMAHTIEEGDTSELLESSEESSVSGQTTVESAAAPKQEVVRATREHLKAIAGMTDDEAKAHNIPLTFWRNTNHVLNQHQEWCGTDDSTEALATHEANLLNLIETTLRSSTKITRRRLRRESALKQLSFGLSQADSFSTKSDGQRIDEIKSELARLEEVKKALEASINARTKGLSESGPVEVAKDKWEEPEYVQDGAERLELATVRKEIGDKAKEVERVEQEKRGVVRRAMLLRDEDASGWRGFRKLDDDRFMLLSLLGKGGYSEVWKAFDRTTAAYVAVKIHQFAEAWSEEQKIAYIKHARRESAIHRTLKHPNIVRLITGFDISETSFATVLEYTPHSDLSTYLEKHKTLRERDARVIIAQILSALAYLDDLPIGKVVHYDLKPGNILLFGDFDIKITDFGLAKQVDLNSSTTDLTSHGAGTMWYLPPECLNGTSKNVVSTKVDIWSTGIIYYQLLYGKRPFGHDVSQRTLLMESALGKTARQLDFPATPKVTKPTIEVIKRMLSNSPKDRPSAAALLSEMFQNEDDGDTPGDQCEEPPAKKAKK